MIASVKPRSSITTAEQAVHDADALVVDAGDPLAPEIGDQPLTRDAGEHADDHHHDQCAAAKSGIGWSNGNGVPGQLAEHASSASVARPMTVALGSARSARAGTGRQRLRRRSSRTDPGSTVPIGEWRRFDALLGERGIALRRRASGRRARAC